MNNEDSILLPVLTGGLAYRGRYSYGGPSSKPRPYQSPALPIASSPDFSVTFCYSLTFNINSKSKGVSFQLNCIAYMHFRRLLGTEHRWCEDPIESALFIIIIIIRDRAPMVRGPY